LEEREECTVLPTPHLHTAGYWAIIFKNNVLNSFFSSMGKIVGNVTVLYVIDVPGVVGVGGGADDEGRILHVSLQAGEDGVHL
jgi:hypothetical protein